MRYTVTELCMHAVLPSPVPRARFKANEMGPAFFDDGKKPVGLGIQFYYTYRE